MKQSAADKIQSAWSQRSHAPSVEEVRSAALLAWEGYLTSVKNMNITHIDISDINSDHLAKLASIVTDRVWINNIRHNNQLSSIMASVQCRWLVLVNMSLSLTETRALATAMRDRVKRVELWRDVNLSVEELCQYDGAGSCGGLCVQGDARSRYRDRLRRWSARVGWTVTEVSSWCLTIERK